MLFNEVKFCSPYFKYTANLSFTEMGFYHFVNNIPTLSLIKLKNIPNSFWNNLVKFLLIIYHFFKEGDEFSLCLSFLPCCMNCPPLLLFLFLLLVQSYSDHCQFHSCKIHNNIITLSAYTTQLLSTCYWRWKSVLPWSHL